MNTTTDNPNTDDAPVPAVLKAILHCASCWQPDARIIGNIRAGDIKRAMLATIPTPDPTNSAASTMAHRLVTMSDQVHGMADAFPESPDHSELITLAATLEDLAAEARRLQMSLDAMSGLLAGARAAGRLDEAPGISLPIDLDSAHTGERHEIRTVLDMTKVPSHRWPWLLKDLLFWLQARAPMIEACAELVASLPDGVTIKLPTADRMVWVDDGENDAILRMSMEAKVPGGPPTP